MVKEIGEGLSEFEETDSITLEQMESILSKLGMYKGENDKMS